MTLDEINAFTFKGKLSTIGMRNMQYAKVLPELYNIPFCDKSEALKAVQSWKSTFVGSFVSKHPRYYGIIERLSTLFGKTPEWSDFTKPNIDLMVDMFLEGAKSSAKTYLSMVKSVLNDAKDEIQLPYQKFAERMSIKSTPSVGVYLNMDDLSKLEKYDPKSTKERIILAQFLCGCYTGARHSDIIMMTVENINGNFLTYVSQKTKVQTVVEAKPILQELLPIAGKHVYSDSLFNKTIREICKHVGIDEQIKVFRRGQYETGPKYKFIASHTARRSFATHLSLLNVPLLQIAKRMGHTDIKTTLRYICCPIAKLEDKANEFFM